MVIKFSRHLWVASILPRPAAAEGPLLNQLNFSICIGLLIVDDLICSTEPLKGVCMGAHDNKLALIISCNNDLSVKAIR